MSQRERGLSVFDRGKYRPVSNSNSFFSHGKPKNASVDGLKPEQAGGHKELGETI